MNAQNHIIVMAEAHHFSSRASLVSCLLQLIVLWQVLDTTEANRCPNGIPCSCTSSKAMDKDAEDTLIIDCSRRAMVSVPYFSGYVEYKISKLLLHDNRITTVESRQFLGLNVSEIILDRNPLQRLDDDAFQGTYGLLSISINGCNLTHVPRNLFDYTPDLIDLSINQNKIYDIPTGTFSKVKHLHFLDLSRNPIRFHETMFDGLENSLRDLMLNGMGLKRIPVHALSILKHLDNLELQDNMFTKLDNETFRGLPKNRYTHYIFDNNFINYIAPDTFHHHPMPVYLDFHENQLKNVDFLKDACFYESSIIHLHGNALQCDCHLYNITKHRQLKLHGRCHGPAQFRNLPLMNEPVVHDSPTQPAPHTARSFAAQAAVFCNDNAPESRQEVYQCPCKLGNAPVTSKHPATSRQHRNHAHEMQCVSYVIESESHVANENGADVAENGGGTKCGRLVSFTFSLVLVVQMVLIL